MAEITTPDAKNPATDIVPVTPHDTNDIDTCRALLVAAGGTLKVDTVAGQTRSVSVPAGYVLVGVTRVYDTGTNASGISALY